jgi:hypothetical protein
VPEEKDEYIEEEFERSIRLLSDVDAGFIGYGVPNARRPECVVRGCVIAYFGDFKREAHSKHFI